MKGKLHIKLSAAISALVMLFALAPAAALAVGGAAINETNFPDANFREYVKQFDKDTDGTLSASELAKVTEINVHFSGISSLKGIEHFTALETLSCYGNNLTSLDVSNNTALTDLDCCINDLTSLDVSQNTALEELYCYSNNLTSLDVSQNPVLWALSCDGNSLTALNVSKNTALELLRCDDNSLMSLDVSKNTALELLRCDDNNLTKLDVSKNLALIVLTCSNNNLMSLDVSHNTTLEYLECGDNNLTSLDVSKNLALEVLLCYENNLTSLDVSKNPALETLFCYDNELTSLDVSKNTELEWLDCDDNVTLIRESANVFTDVNLGDYYYDAVQWAVRNGITTGTGATTFSPDMVCTRSQIVTFLWRAAGSPKATSQNPFTDFKPGDYYYDAVLWAVENGITTGTGAAIFSPDAVCTRAQIVTFLWRAAGSPEATSKNPFTDVKTSDYYCDAVLWAVENGITTGTGATTFSPNSVCTRAQAVTFLYRADDIK